MSVIGSARTALTGHGRRAWPRPSRMLVGMVVGTIAVASLAGSAVSERALSAASGTPVARSHPAADDQAALQGMASALTARYAANPAALRALGATALQAGRNDATVAAFLRLRWIGRLASGLERYGGQLDAAGEDELALAVAGTQRYSELIHNALLHDGPDQLIVVSLKAQRLIAYDHGQVVVDTLVTTGRSALPTDIGAMHVWKKDSPWTMQSPWPKGSPDWYPDTQVQMVAWFTKNGEGLHDASWQPPGTYGPGSENGPYGSHGCIHVPPAAETTLFTWAPIGTPVVVIPGDGSPVAAQVAQQSVDAMGNPIAGVRGD